MIDNILEKFNEKKVRAVCVILMAAFLADAGYSALHPNTGKGITDIQACLPDAADDHTDTRRI